MKISQALPQFKENRGLVLVCGEQEAAVNIAEKGVYETWGAFHLEHDQYTDREGRFGSLSQGQTYGVGAPLKDLKQKYRMETRKKLAELLSRLEIKKTDEVYLFAPSQVLNIFKDGLPNAIKAQIRATFPGDFSHEHPFFILSKIKEEAAGEPSMEIPAEVADLLSRGNPS